MKSTSFVVNNFGHLYISRPIRIAKIVHLVFLCHISIHSLNNQGLIVSKSIFSNYFQNKFELTCTMFGHTTLEHVVEGISSLSCMCSSPFPSLLSETRLV